MNPLPHNLYEQNPEPAKSCLLGLHSLVRAFDTNITDGVKYGMPVFYYRGKIFCYLWVDKKTGWPYILIAGGNKINHPQLLAGHRKRMKVLLVNPREDIAVDTIYEILEMAKVFLG